MNITKNTVGKELTLKLEGRLDTTTVGQLEVELNAIPEDVKNLVFDFESLDYISSAGLRQLLIAQKKMGSKDAMKLVNVRPEVYEVLEISGFSDIINVEQK